MPSINDAPEDCQQIKYWIHILSNNINIDPAEPMLNHIDSLDHPMPLQ